MDLAILDSLVTAPMRTEHPQPLHLPVGRKSSQGTVHASFDVMDRPVFKVFCEGFMAGKGGGREPHQVFHSQLFCNIKDLVGNKIAIAEMMVGGDGHPVF